MMSEVKIKLYNQFIECRDETCGWSRECTNHHSAGDWRMEHGVLPRFTGYDAHEMIAWCELKNTPYDENCEVEMGEALLISDIPAQINLF